MFGSKRVKAIRHIIRELIADGNTVTLSCTEQDDGDDISISIQSAAYDIVSSMNLSKRTPMDFRQNVPREHKFAIAMWSANDFVRGHTRLMQEDDLQYVTTYSSETKTTEIKLYASDVFPENPYIEI